MRVLLIDSMDADRSIVADHDEEHGDLHGINRLLGDGGHIDHDAELGMLNQLTQIDSKTIEDVLQGVLNEREVNSHAGVLHFMHCYTYIF